MASKQDIPALLSSKEGYDQLSDEARQRLLTMVGEVEEVVVLNTFRRFTPELTEATGAAVLRWV